MKHQLTNNVIESIFQQYSKNVSLSLTGTRWGKSFDEIENLYVDYITEYKNKLPKCLRNQKFNSTKRILELKQYYNQKS